MHCAALQLVLSSLYPELQMKYFHSNIFIASKELNSISFMDEKVVYFQNLVIYVPL